jgi:selenide, water dikinase
VLTTVKHPVRAGRNAVTAAIAERNLEWVRPHTETGVPEDELLLLADAQTSGGLLVAGEVPGYPVIGELGPGRSDGITLIVR